MPFCFQRQDRIEICINHALCVWLPVLYQRCIRQCYVLLCLLRSLYHYLGSYGGQEDDEGCRFLREFCSYVAKSYGGMWQLARVAWHTKYNTDYNSREESSASPVFSVSERKGLGSVPCSLFLLLVKKVRGAFHVFEKFLYLSCQIEHVITAYFWLPPPSTIMIRP